ncbi:MAG TPA: hypothetical protein VNJ10_01340 [Sphingomonas sp.]|nr:hypothetical protein [Sphingomonas sp.]
MTRIIIVAAMLAGASQAAIGSPGTAEAKRTAGALPLSSAQIRGAKATGTGCSWSLAKDRGIRFAAADDHAVVRLPSGVVALRPAADARDLFPFTHDRWSGDGVAVRVAPVGPATRKGSETLEQVADLEVAVGGSLRKRRGLMVCGS